MPSACFAMDPGLKPGEGNAVDWAEVWDGKANRPFLFRVSFHFFHLKHFSWYGSVGWQLMRQQYNHISPPPPHHSPMHHAMHHPCTDPCTARLARRPNPNPTPPNRGTFELHDTAAGSSLILSSMANAHWPWGTPCCGRPWVWVND